MIKVTILGCGSSTGVPVIACRCAICKSNNPFNHRTRSAALIQSSTTTVLVDCGFDIRFQLLKAGVEHIDAVILTHHHADHIMGLDHLRIFAHNNNVPIPIYTDHTTTLVCNFIFGYLQHLNQVIYKQVKLDDHITIGDIPIQLFKQLHSDVDSIGFRVGNFIYANDVRDFPAASQQWLYNAETLVIDCKEYVDTSAHLGLPGVLKWSNIFKPKNVFLTNMSHKIDYNELCSKTPQNFRPCYDGIQFET